MAITLSLKKLNRTKLNLFLDIGLALAYVVEMERHFTGTRNHELIGLGLAAAFLLHIVLHWHWIVGVTRAFFRKVMHESRLNHVLVVLLLLNMAVTIITGILISETLGLNFGIRQIAGLSVERLHTVSADFSLLLVAIHVAMHWKWLGTYAKKYLFNIRVPFGHKATVMPQQPSHSEA